MEGTLKEYQIEIYCDELKSQILPFFKKIFLENNRLLDLASKDNDLMCIKETYLKNGCFWCLLYKRKLIGTIGIRNVSEKAEIRRFFILSKHQKKGLGAKLLETVLKFAISQNTPSIYATTKTDGIVANYLFRKYGFAITTNYRSKLDVDGLIFYKIDLTVEYKYVFQLNQLCKQNSDSLILNPTENYPIINPKCNTSFFEGLYVSERQKDVTDKVIFAGRNDYINFFESIKKEWGAIIKAADVDLKTLAGLNAHLILFMCILQTNEKVMLLPELCGGHFSTENILRRLGARIIHMVADCKNHCVDVRATKHLIETERPNYIFVDRSEGLIYEDFSWLANVNKPYKIFDASQYFTQIIADNYPSPFDMGFDMLVTTLHKNYPGPQKGLIAVKKSAGDSIWDRYQKDAKTFISNTHPMNIANSLIPYLNLSELKFYIQESKDCILMLENELIARDIPIVVRPDAKFPALHLWILCKSKEESYAYFQKLESVGFLTNYRFLPYNLGYGLRIGVTAAVRSGLRLIHIKELADIMGEIYHAKTPLNIKIIKKAKKLIQQIIAKRAYTL